MGTEGVMQCLSVTRWSIMPTVGHRLWHIRSGRPKELGSFVLLVLNQVGSWFCCSLFKCSRFPQFGLFILDIDSLTCLQRWVLAFVINHIFFYVLSGFLICSSPICCLLTSSVHIGRPLSISAGDLRSCKIDVALHVILARWQSVPASCVFKSIFLYPLAILSANPFVVWRGYCVLEVVLLSEISEFLTHIMWAVVTV